MWNLEPTDLFDRRFKRFHKKNRNEAQAVLNNLDSYLKLLQEGVKPLQIKAGWLHPEPMGVVAIDQKGGGNKLKQTRLYAYAYEHEETVYLITIGDKQSQRQDIKDCKDFVDSLREQETREKNDEK